MRTTARRTGDRHEVPSRVRSGGRERGQVARYPESGWFAGGVGPSAYAEAPPARKNKQASRATANMPISAEAGEIVTGAGMRLGVVLSLIMSSRSRWSDQLCCGLRIGIRSFSARSGTRAPSRFSTRPVG